MGKARVPKTASQHRQQLMHLSNVLCPRRRQRRVGQKFKDACKSFNSRAKSSPKLTMVSSLLIQRFRRLYLGATSPKVRMINVDEGLCQRLKRRCEPKWQPEELSAKCSERASVLQAIHSESANGGGFNLSRFEMSAAAVCLHAPNDQNGSCDAHDLVNDALLR